MTFTKLPHVKGSIACLTCGSGADEVLSMERVLLVGFGSAGYSVDGESIWDEHADDDFPSAPTAGDVDYLASLEPDRDWRIYFCAPLYESEYQYQDGHWVLIRKGRGFA